MKICKMRSFEVGGAYCILEGVAKVGRRLLEGCCIVYLDKGGGYCIFRCIFDVVFLCFLEIKILKII
jgi:hypothetical protein